MAFQDFLNKIGASIIDPLASIWYWLVQTVPDIIAAIIILIVGYLIALAISTILERVLTRIKFDEWLFEKTNLSQEIGRFNLTHVISILAKWYIIVLFLAAVAGRIQLQTLAAFFQALSIWIPQVIVAVIIALIGVGIGLYVEKAVIKTRAKAAGIVAMLTKWVIYIFTVLLVLDQVGVRIALAQTSFLIILAGTVLTLALMLGISFGLGFKEEAKKIISDIKRKL